MRFFGRGEKSLDRAGCVIKAFCCVCDGNVNASTEIAEKTVIIPGCRLETPSNLGKFTITCGYSNRLLSTEPTAISSERTGLGLFTMNP